MGRGTQNICSILPRYQYSKASAKINGRNIVAGLSGANMYSQLRENLPLSPKWNLKGRHVTQTPLSSVFPLTRTTETLKDIMKTLTKNSTPFSQEFFNAQIFSFIQSVTGNAEKAAQISEEIRRIYTDTTDLAQRNKAIAQKLYDTFSDIGNTLVGQLFQDVSTSIKKMNTSPSEDASMSPERGKALCTNMLSLMQMIVPSDASYLKRNRMIRRFEEVLSVASQTEMSPGYLLGDIRNLLSWIERDITLHYNALFDILMPCLGSDISVNNKHSVPCLSVVKEELPSSGLDFSLRNSVERNIHRVNEEIAHIQQNFSSFPQGSVQAQFFEDLKKYLEQISNQLQHMSSSNIIFKNYYKTLRLHIGFIRDMLNSFPYSAEQNEGDFFIFCHNSVLSMLNKRPAPLLLILMLKPILDRAKLDKNTDDFIKRAQRYFEKFAFTRSSSESAQVQDIVVGAMHAIYSAPTLSSADKKNLSQVMQLCSSYLKYQEALARNDCVDKLKAYKNTVNLLNAVQQPSQNPGLYGIVDRIRTHVSSSALLNSGIPNSPRALKKALSSEQMVGDLNNIVTTLRSICQEAKTNLGNDFHSTPNAEKWNSCLKKAIEDIDFLQKQGFCSWQNIDKIVDSLQDIPETFFPECDNLEKLRKEYLEHKQEYERRRMDLLAPYRYLP